MKSTLGVRCSMQLSSTSKPSSPTASACDCRSLVRAQYERTTVPQWQGDHLDGVFAEAALEPSLVARYAF